jgi:Xaa-Pro aminopeptidase
MVRWMLSLFPCVPLLLIASQDVPPAGAIADADRGDDFFKPQWHAGRRKALLERVASRKPVPEREESRPESSESRPNEPEKPGVIVMRGAPARRDYDRFRQTNDFFYLSGVEAPGAALVMTVADRKEILFLAPPEFGEGVWLDLRPHAPPKASTNGKPHPGHDLARKLGFADIRDSGELDAVLDSLKDEGPFLTPFAPEEYEATSRDEASGYEQRQEEDPLDGRKSRERQLSDKLKDLYGVKVKNLTVHLDRLRRVKMPEEIEAMRRACKIAAAGHVAAMRATRPGIREWQIGSEAAAAFLRMGSPGHSYFPIVGAGKNAIILHYTQTDAVVERDDVILMDYAPEWRYYASDVTRSWPASGKFTSQGRKIYEAVLRAQEAAIAAVKPGVPFSAVSKAAADVLRAEGFPPEKYMPHGLSHPIGLATHDVGKIDPLVPGVVFTIEPGIYDRESGIGVRIEDVIAVTESGCESLSAGAPKSVQAIEAIVGRMTPRENVSR